MTTTIELPFTPSVTPVCQLYSLSAAGAIVATVGSPVTGTATSSDAVYSLAFGTLSAGDYHGKVQVSSVTAGQFYMHVYSDGTYVLAEDWSSLKLLISGANVNVLPLTGTLSTRTDDNTITTKYDEATTVTMTLTSGSLTGLTLSFVVTNAAKAVVLTIADGSITRTATSWTLKIPRTFNQTLASYTWALRDVTASDNVELQGGVLSCEYAPTGG